MLLCSNTDGRFLWASCQIDQLRFLRTIRDIQNALLSLPLGLYNMYERILLEIRSEDQVLAVRTLRFFAHSIIPLRLEEIIEAIAVEEDSSSLSGLQKLLDPEDIFHICGSLIRHFEPGEELGLSHDSVYRYLSTANTRARTLHPYHISSTESAIVLTRTCLTYLSFSDICWTSIQPKSTFLDYALRHWWRHLPVTQEDLNQVLPSLERFFGPKTSSFSSVVLALNYVEGEYSYPIGMQLVHFCASHSLSLLLSTLARHVGDYDCTVEDGRRALHMAAEKGHEEIVRILLSHGADVNALTGDGRTPLQCAMECGNIAVTRLLVSHGADVNCVISHGGTPLSLAVKNGWHSTVQFLLQNRADSDIKLDNGVTILHVAAEAGSDSHIFQMLFETGANRYARDKWSWTPLHYASYYGHVEAAFNLMVRFEDTKPLLKEQGWTPLHFAVEHEHMEMLKLFKRLCANRFIFGSSTSNPAIDFQHFTYQNVFVQCHIQLPPWKGQNSIQTPPCKG